MVWLLTSHSVFDIGGRWLVELDLNDAKFTTSNRGAVGSIRLIGYFLDCAESILALALPNELNPDDSAF